MKTFITVLSFLILSAPSAFSMGENTLPVKSFESASDAYVKASLKGFMKVIEAHNRNRKGQRRIISSVKNPEDRKVLEKF